MQTCWALIALMEAEFPERGPIEKGVRLIMRRQAAKGGWAQEGIEGVFNKSWSVSDISFPRSLRSIFSYHSLLCLTRLDGWAN